mgnify:CR=1 FL=1
MKKAKIDKVKRVLLAFSIIGASLVAAPANAAQTYTGTEDSIVDITPIKAASILTFTYTGEGVFTASPVDATGKEGLSYMLQIGDFTETYYQDATTKPIVALAIKGTGEWSVIATLPADQLTQNVTKASDSGWTQFRVSSVYSDGQTASATAFGIPGEFK